VRTRNRHFGARQGLLLVTATAVIAVAMPVDATRAGDHTGLVPLTDMAPDQQYQGYCGSLYPDGRNGLSGRHLADGLHEALQIQPLDPNGLPDPAGRIVLLSIGMSNTSSESAAFQSLFANYGDRNPRLQFVNGAQSGQTAALICNPAATFWTVVDQRLTQASVTPAQVQAIWYKEADANPTSGFPAYATTLRDESVAVVQIIKTRYPNTRIVYVSSRIYGGYATTGLNPEPYAYESGLAMKWLIEQQIQGDPALNYDPQRGPAVAPFLQWGPYLWADGVVPRSDGLTWVVGEFQSDGTHPSSPGQAKVANLLLQFLINSPTSRVWFVKPDLQQLLGDMNGDRAVNFDDVNPFVAALVSQARYEARYPGCRWLNGDIDGGGDVNFDDINPFVALLASFGTK
jgi:hypothetical protein